MFNINMQVILDPQSPGSFLATYKRLLGNAKPTRSRTLLLTASRLIRDYMSAQQELAAATALPANSVTSWIGKRKSIRLARQRIANLKDTLMQWVSSTINFFGSLSGVKANGRA